MQKEILEKYLEAGRIAAEVREESKTFINVDAKLIDIAEKIESLIREKGALPAFPVNLSLNEVAAHYTPTKNDDVKIKDGDLIKVDIGIHADGYIGDTAYTLSFGNYEQLVKASEEALEEAIKLCKPGTLLSDISARIEETIRSFGFNPISNLTGHGLDRFNLHAEPQVPNIKFSSDYKLKENQVIAIEPFATNGSGMVKESDLAIIFRFIEEKPVRNQDGRLIMRFAEQFNGLPFTERWIPIDSLIRIRIALRELREKGVIYDYPILKEAAGGIISQAEHTVVVKEEPIITTK